MKPGSTWTFLKPWANQSIFLLEMFVLSYVNKLYPRLCLSSSRFCIRLGTDLTNLHVLLLIYVNETIYLLGNLPFFKIHVNDFMARDDSPSVNVILKYMLWVRGLVLLSEFWDISFL